MGKIKEKFEYYKTKKDAERHGRNFSQQKYRNQLAAQLKTERKKGRLKAAEELLKREKCTDQYAYSLLDGRIPGKNEIKLIIQQGFLDYVCNNIMKGKFKGIDEEIAYDLLKSGRSEFVAFQLDKFEGVDHGKIAEYFFEHGNGDLVARYLYNFKGLDHKEIAEKLIEAGMLHDLANHLSYFNGLVFDKDFAEKLIQGGEGWCIVYNLDKFEGLDSKIADYLIKKGELRAVACNLDKFGMGSRSQEIAEKLIEKGELSFLLKNMSKIEGLNYKDIAEMLIKKGKLGGLIKHLDKFEGLDEEIAQKLINAGCGDVVEENPEKFGLKKEK